MNFSEKLKTLRLEKGISQTALAEAIHISRSAVAKWENGLGLPSGESLELLAEYFGVSVEELTEIKEENHASKIKMTENEKKAVFGFAVGAVIGLFILGLIFVEPLREMLSLLGLGVIFVILGIFNMLGNIATVHWYNRRKVSAENQKPYCMFVGLGTLIIGIGLIVSGVVQVFGTETAGGAVITAGIIAGLALILYAQFKYNKGLF